MKLAKKLNFFPAWHRVSNHFSPSMIVHRENLDYNKYLEFVLGECAQALDEPNKKNNNKHRTLDSLFSSPNMTKQGRCELLHLSANKIIIQRKI